MNDMAPMRIRASRFLSERYRQRERPRYFTDFFFWSVIVITETWAMFTLIHAMAMLR
jgi:hypothetical protein